MGNSALFGGGGRPDRRTGGGQRRHSARSAGGGEGGGSEQVTQRGAGRDDQHLRPGAPGQAIYGPVYGGYTAPVHP
jgi:hypothetical protein